MQKASVPKNLRRVVLSGSSIESTQLHEASTSFTVLPSVKCFSPCCLSAPPREDHPCRTRSRERASSAGITNFRSWQPGKAVLGKARGPVRWPASGDWSCGTCVQDTSCSVQVIPLYTSMSYMFMVIGGLRLLFRPVSFTKSRRRPKIPEPDQCPPSIRRDEALNFYVVSADSKTELMRLPLVGPTNSIRPNVNNCLGFQVDSCRMSNMPRESMTKCRS